MTHGGGITVNEIDTSGGVSVLNGDAGDVNLLAGNDIFFPFSEDSPSLIFAYGLAGGTITLKSDTAIIQESAPFGTDPFALSTIESLGEGSQPNGDITLSAPFISIGGSVLTTSFGSATSGDITILADSLVTDQATILTDTFGPSDSGDLVAKANSINLDFTLLGTSSTSDSGGRSGDVSIQTETLTSRRGAQIGSLAFFIGDAGNVNVKADSINLSGFQPGNLSGNVFAPSTISSVIEEGAEGNGGEVRIETNTLRITEGADISTSSFGNGNAGAVIVNATDLIQVDGAVFTEFDGIAHPSNISSEVFPNSIGEGGTIDIRTGVLEVTNGGIITSGSGGEGDAGSIFITASDSLIIDGIKFFPEANDRLISQASVVVSPESTGDAGSITISTPFLSLSNGGLIVAEAFGDGQGGDVIARGQELLIKNGSEISAETVSNTGGNITLEFSDIIALTEGSRISATAGTALSGGDGGNILINTEFLVAEPDTNNDITANAFEGSGGSVDITATGIFGLAPRSREELETLLGTTDPELLDPAFLPTSDITAISRVNPELDGIVIIRSPDVDPNRDITELPSNVVDASRLIAQGCSASGSVGNVIGSLIVTGRGGLPQSPSDSLGNQDLLIAWDTLEGNNAEEADRISKVNEGIEEKDGEPEAIALLQESLSEADSPKQIVEFQSLTRREDGKVILTAQLPQDSHHSRWNRAATCVTPIP